MYHQDSGVARIRAALAVERKSFVDCSYCIYKGSPGPGHILPTPLHQDIKVDVVFESSACSVVNI